MNIARIAHCIFNGGACKQEGSGRGTCGERKNIWKMAVAVVEPSGVLVYYEKMDNTQFPKRTSGVSPIQQLDLNSVRLRYCASAPSAGRKQIVLRVPYEEFLNVLLRILLKLGFERDRAALCAQLFADASRDGVSSHGLNRFPQFVRMINSGVVEIHAQPEPVATFRSLERWDGRSGPGNLNAHRSMARAIELSHQHGMGCVALANTNHWMRGGNYGWQAADAGVIGICWTNTLPNLPPWGASDPRVGNNPLVIAVPRNSGHVVLDMAISQFSYGALASYRLRGEQLPVEGGFDSAGRLTRDPAAIEASKRPLPVGYWKGSGLALLLDMIASLVSGGQATHQITPEPERETRLSQVFIAIDPSCLDRAQTSENLADQIIQHFQFPPPSDGERVRYPGERVLEIRFENMAKGIPVEPSIWSEVQKLNS